MARLWLRAKARVESAKIFRQLPLALALLLLVAQPATAASDRFGAIVVDAATGAVLYEEKADRRHYPASLTKMMTLYLLFDAVERGRLSLDSRLAVSKKAARQPPSKVGVKSGSTISVEQAIHSLAIKSGNDVAVVVAEALSGSEAAFGRDMTAMARRLGMWRTSFFNASGLPDERQLSTPRDMAKLSRALLYDFPQYYHYFSTRGFSFEGRRFNTHNRLLHSYGGADGIKTGYTRAAGYNISVSAVKNGRRLIAVVFGADSSAKRNQRAARLLNRTFPQADPGHPTQQFAQASSGGKLPALRPNLVGGAKPAVSTPVVPQPAAPAPTLVAAKPKAQPAPKVVAKAPTPQPAPQPAPQVAAVAAQPAVARGVGTWSIQVGAFSQSASAEAAAQAALQQSRNLAAGRVQVVAVSSNGNQLYRGRVGGLDEALARQACEFRRLHGAPCLVVAPGS